MSARLGRNQINMLTWLARKGGERVFVGDATPADFELSGWEIHDAVRTLRSLRSRGFVHVEPKCRGFVSLTTEGRAALARVQGVQP